MNLLRATVNQRGGWWELKLLDLAIVADGDSEDTMLRDLEHTLMSEYHIAVKSGKTPFVRLFNLKCPPEVSQAWLDGDKRLRVLRLTDEVKMALAAVFRKPLLSEFSIQRSNAA